MELKYTKNARLLFLALLGLILACMAYMIFIYNPLEAILNKILTISPGSMVFGLWKDPPYEIFIKIYLFNVTNSVEFLRGDEKLRVKEVGPYVYKEILFNTNATFNENGTLSFIPRRILEFSQERSIGDAHVDTLLFPNIPLLGISAALHGASMFSNLAVASASSYLGSKSFLNLTIHEFLYGYDDPLVTLANNILPNWIDFSRFGILDRIMALDNATNVVNMFLKQPNEDDEFARSYSIDKWNGSPGLAAWGYTTPKDGDDTERSMCDSVAGTYLGSIFPTDIKTNSTFNVYRHGFCRSFPLNYEKSIVDSNGFKGYVFKARDDIFFKPEKNIDNECYCHKTQCLYDGLSDMSACYYGIPIVMSQPHFLNADPEIVKQTDGLLADKTKHEFYMVINPELGAPSEVKLRLQINLNMPNTKYNSKTKPFNNIVIPMVWVELCVDEPPSRIQMFISLFNILPVVQEVLMYVLAVVGLALVFGSALATVLHLFDTRNHRKDHFRRRGTYSEIPVFPLKTKLLKPEILIRK